jgi:hypothetical protein
LQTNSGRLRISSVWFSVGFVGRGAANALEIKDDKYKTERVLNRLVFTVFYFQCPPLGAKPTLEMRCLLCGLAPLRQGMQGV